MTKGCFCHYQHLSVRVTPDSLISSVCVSLCVRVRQLFVLIRIKEPFRKTTGKQTEVNSTLRRLCCLNPAATDLCLPSDLPTSCFTRQAAQPNPTAAASQRQPEQCRGSREVSNTPVCCISESRSSTLAQSRSPGEFAWPSYPHAKLHLFTQ